MNPIRKSVFFLVGLLSPSKSPTSGKPCLHLPASDAFPADYPAIFEAEIAPLCTRPLAGNRRRRDFANRSKVSARLNSVRNLVSTRRSHDRQAELIWPAAEGPDILHRPAASSREQRTLFAVPAPVLGDRATFTRDQIHSIHGLLSKSIDSHLNLATGDIHVFCSE